MPRTTNPGNIRVGPGQKAPDPALDAILTGFGIPTDIGTSSITSPDLPVEGTTGGTPSASSESLLEDLFSSWVLGGGLLSFLGVTTANIASTSIILRGKKNVVSAGSVTVPAVDAPYYFYLDCTTVPLIPAFAYTTSLPLPGPEDILLARADVVAGVLDPLTYINLTNPLQDIDRRVDILVGDLGGWEPSPTPHFATLAEAVAYVGEIMSPASGTSGKQWRIRVIGPTVETAVPILIPANGIYIEGAVSPTTASTIKWSTPATPLINFNGHDNLTFENLSFEYLNVGQPADPTGQQVVFTNGTAGSPVDRLTIRHCRFNGNGKGHGFLLANTAARQFTYPLIEHNNCTSTDFGLALYDTRCTSGEFRNNIFTCIGTKQTMPPYLDAIHIETTGDASRNHIQANDIGFGFGVASYSRGIVIITPATNNHNVIENNRITRTLEMGIHVQSEETTIRDNTLFYTHLSGAFSYGQTAKIGIWQEGVTGLNTVIQNNHIEIDTPAVGSRSIWTEAQNGTVSHNAVNQSLEVGSNTEVHDNHLDGTGADGSIYVGGGCIVTGNTIPNNLVTAAAGHQIHISDNTIAGAITIGAGGNGHNISNNSAATITLAGAGAILQGNTATTVTAVGARTALHVTGNTFNTFSADLVLSNVTGNWISQMTNSCTDTVFGDNVFESTVTVSGTGNQFNNNLFELGDVTLNGPATSCVFTSNRVPSNLTITGGSLNLVGDNRISGTVTVTSSNSVIEGNVLGSTLTVTGLTNTISGNHVSGTLTAATADESVIDSNWVGGAVVITAGESVVSNNIFKSTFAVTGANNIIDSNNITTSMTLSGSGTVIQGNTITTVTGGSLSALHITGNTFNTFSVGLIASNVTGNYISKMTNSCTSTVFGDNVFESGVTVSGTGNHFNNNYFEQGNVTLNGPASGCIFTSNLIVFNLTITGGTKNTVADNRIGGAVIVSSATSTVTGNILDSTLAVTGSDSTVGDNHVGGAVTITGSQGSVTSNTLASTLAVVGDKNTIGANTVTTSIAVTGVENVTSNNLIDTGGLTVTGADNSILGNHLLTGALSVPSGDRIIVTDNHADTLSVTAASYVIEGNYTVTTATVTGTGGLINGNRITTGLTVIGGTGTVIGDNIVGGVVAITNSQGTVKGNTFNAAATITGSYAAITGNYSDSLTVDGSSNAISGNKVLGTFSLLGGDSHAVTGNVLRGTVSSAMSEMAFSQNSGNNINWTLSGTNNVIMGNQLGEGVLIVAGTGNTVIGNITGGIGVTAASAGPQPANTVAVGNRVGVGGSLYGTPVVPTTATDDNIQ